MKQKIKFSQAPLDFRITTIALLIGVGIVAGLAIADMIDQVTTGKWLTIGKDLQQRPLYYAMNYFIFPTMALCVYTIIRTIQLGNKYGW